VRTTELTKSPCEHFWGLVYEKSGVLINKILTVFGRVKSILKPKISSNLKGHLKRLGLFQTGINEKGLLVTNDARASIKFEYITLLFTNPPR
jgi:hypothetical protein